MTCISYKYSKTIGPKIFNFNKAVQDFSVETFREDGYSCSCSDSKFKYNPHGHVLTGDLSFFNNDKLKEIITKGPKYREPRKILWHKNKKIIFDAVEKYATAWAKREGASRNVFMTKMFFLFLKILMFNPTCSLFTEILFWLQLIKQQTMLLLFARSFFMKF